MKRTSKSMGIASMRVECEKNQEKMIERNIHDARELKRTSLSVASVMVECWYNDAQILERSINDGRIR